MTASSSMPEPVTAAHPARRRGRELRPFAVLATVELVLLLVSRHNSYYTSIGLQWTLFAVLAQGFNIIAGYAGRLAFGNIIFYGLSAYLVVAGTVHHWYPEVIGLAVAVAACCALAYLLSLALWRVNGLLFALATFALAAMLEQLMTVFGTFGKSSGLQEPLALKGSILHLSLTTQFGYLVIGAVLVLAGTAVTLWFARSTLGREAQATREDRVAAGSCGIHTRRVTALAWMISAAMTAVAGVYYAQFNLFVEPTSAFGLPTITLIVVPAILGGLGAVWGPVLGSVIIPVGLLLARLSSGHGIAGLNLLVYGVILIVVMRVYPGGLTAAIDALQARFRSREETVPLPPAPRRLSQAPAEEMIAPARVPALATVDGPHDTVDRPLLEVSEVHKSFGGVHALGGVNFSVATAEIVGLLGPNGAGKSTLFNCIAGVDTADRGSIILGGRDISKLAAHERARAGIARTYQNVRLFPHLTAMENVAVGALRRWDSAKASARAASMLEAVGLAASPSEQANGLSLVDQRRVELARAMVTDARLVMLDEVMTGLNEAEAENMRAVVRDLNHSHGTAFVIVEHVMGHILPLISRVVIMEQGRVLADGDPDEILQREDVLEAYFGTPASGIEADGD